MVAAGGGDAIDLEAELAALLYDRGARAAHPLLAALDPAELDEAAAGVRRMVSERAHRGSGGWTSWFPRTLAAWPGELDELLARFCASAHCRDWSELPFARAGVSLEEALYRFLCAIELGDASVREDEFLGAVVRGLAVTPRAQFAWPAELRPAPGGCFALTHESILHAAIDGRYLRGPVTPLIAALLSGGELHGSEARAVRGTLQTMRLLP